MLNTQLKTCARAYLSIHREEAHYPGLSLPSSSSSSQPHRVAVPSLSPPAEARILRQNPTLRVLFWISCCLFGAICFRSGVSWILGGGAASRRRSGGDEMAGGKEPIEVRFRLFDGTDIGPSKYDPSTTVSALKEFILARWPQDKDIAPKTVNDLKLINAGRILENNRTLAESRIPVGEVPGSVITMHVVVPPPQADKNSEKQLANSPKQTRCGCSIL